MFSSALYAPQGLPEVAGFEPLTAGVHLYISEGVGFKISSHERQA
jgi:hypothetical protein